MRGGPSTLLVILTVCAVSIGVGAVRAASARPAREPMVMAHATVSVEQAVRMVEQRFHARVVKTQTEQDNGRTVYVMRLLNDSGQVWTVRVDAASGSVQ